MTGSQVLEVHQLRGGSKGMSMKKQSFPDEENPEGLVRLQKS